MSIISGLIILPFSFTAHGELLAITDNAIQGSAPYLTFDEGKTKATDTSGLLSIKLSDETTITSTEDVSTGTDPIALPKDDDTFASVMTLVPLFANNAAYPTIKLTELIKDNKYWGDDNGDENPSVTPATAGLTVAWYSGSTTATNGTDITATVKTTPDRALTHCDAPYRLTLTSTAGTLSTEYGDPKSSTFAASNHSYFIKPKPPTDAYVCFARPNLAFNNAGGPVTQWNVTKGFKLQDKATPSSNFPTTGANNLFFDLTIENGSSADVGYIKESGGSSEMDIEITQSPLGANMVRVRLIGPTDANKPTEIFSPTTFNLYSDTGKTNLIYSFTVSKWFIVKPGGNHNLYVLKSYCTSLGYNYRVPLIADYTARRSALGYSTRQIDGGFFAEWGNMNIYYSEGSNSGIWSTGQYWTSETTAFCTGICSIGSSSGGIGYTYPGTADRKGACVSP